MGFSRWKRPIVRSFLQGSAVRFVRNTNKVPDGATVVVWGKKTVTPGLNIVRLARIFHHKRSAEPISPYNMSVEVKSQRGFRRCQSVPQIGSSLDGLADG